MQVGRQAGGRDNKRTTPGTQQAGKFAGSMMPGQAGGGVDIYCTAEQNRWGREQGQSPVTDTTTAVTRPHSAPYGQHVHTSWLPIVTASIKGVRPFLSCRFRSGFFPSRSTQSCGAGGGIDYDLLLFVPGERYSGMCTVNNL